MVDREAAAYLAGMIDGEGSVQVWGDHVRRSVRIANTDTSLIDAVCECCEKLGIEYRIYPLDA